MLKLQLGANVISHDALYTHTPVPVGMVITCKASASAGCWTGPICVGHGARVQ